MSRGSRAAVIAWLGTCAAGAAATPAEAQQTISIGQSVSGALGASDQSRSGRGRYHLYLLSGQAGQRVQIDMVSNAFDSYLILEDQAGRMVADDDDGGGNRNARLIHTLPATASYRVVATTYGPNAFGAYTLSVRLLGGPAVAAAQPQPLQPVGQPQPIAQPQALPQPIGNPATGMLAGMIGLNQQVTGNLTAGDPRYNGRPYQAWGLQCQAGQAFQLDILSLWDNYAIVFDPRGAEVASNDDGPEGLNAQLIHTCTVSGSHRLVVTTYSAETTPGTYTLQVRSAQAAAQIAQQAAPIGQPQPLGQPAPLQPEPQAQPGATLPRPATGAMPITGRIPDPGEVGQIQIGQNMQGRLETGDQLMNDGTWADVWQFQGTAGQTVVIELRSDEFDTYLQLLDTRGTTLAEDDDSLGDLDSQVTYRLPATGTYQIVVNNFSDERRSGIYTLSLHLQGAR